MRRPRSLQMRLALALGVALSVLWLAAALLTGRMLHNEIDEVFDSSLQETAQRILPLAVADILDRDEDGVARDIALLRPHEEYFTYVVRDAQGRVLIRSHGAEDAIFLPFEKVGFRQTEGHRLYYDSALQGSVTIAVAEPLSHRAAVTREMLLGLGLPVLLVIPLSFLIILALVRGGFAPLRRLRMELAQRGAQDLSPLADGDMPLEIAPVTRAVNQLLIRLGHAFEAERSFAANAAHELRTPVAGAIAQAQRLRSETKDLQAAARAGDIEATLKRLNRLSEKLMQLARAEGGRLRGSRARDLAPVLKLVVSDFERAAPGRLDLTLPPSAVLCDLDPDAFGILCRNLIENALRHGPAAGSVAVALGADAVLRVSNGGPVIAPETLARLTARFERGGTKGDGTGLGLAIIQTIVERAGASLTLHSPRPGQVDGFMAEVHLPQPAGAGA
jgi:two-component system, OmpR family, sensor kinase